MKDNKLCYLENEAGCFVYLRTHQRDIMLNQEPITDPQQVRQIKQYIDQSNMRLLAYERYKVLLNSLLTVFGPRNLDPKILDVIQKALQQYCDLDGNK